VVAIGNREKYQVTDWFPFSIRPFARLHDLEAFAFHKPSLIRLGSERNVLADAGMNSSACSAKQRRILRGHRESSRRPINATLDMTLILSNTDRSKAH